MPKSTNHKNPKLTNSFTFEGWSLVYCLPQPFLNWYVPASNFYSHMHICLNLGYIRWVNLVEFLMLDWITDSGRLNWTDRQFPSEIVFKAKYGYTKPCIKYYVKSSLLRELYSLHVARWNEHISYSESKSAGDCFNKCNSDLFPGWRNFSIRFPLFHEVLVVWVINHWSKHRAWQKVWISKKVHITW